MRLKAEPNDSRRKTPKLIIVTWPKSSMQRPAQMVGPRTTSAPTTAGKAKGQTATATDGQTQVQAGVGGASARYGWQEPMISITERLPCLLHGARLHCSQKMAKDRVSTDTAAPPAGSNRLSLGQQSCVQESMLFRVTTQVFLSEVLTEVVSALRTGRPNGKCPHGGFWLINLFSLTCS